MAQPKLSVEARRIRMIIVTLPIMAATSCQSYILISLDSFLISLDFNCADVLYKRHVLGEPQRHLPTTLDGDNSSTKLLGSEKKDEKVSLYSKNL